MIGPHHIIEHGAPLTLVTRDNKQIYILIMQLYVISINLETRETIIDLYTF